MPKPVWLRGTWRLGAREQRRIQIVFIVIICGLLAFVLYEPFMDFVQRRDFQVCQNNVHKIAMGLMTYTQDWDDTLPPAAIWADAAASHMVATSGTGKNVRSYFRCPLDNSGKPSSYVYNQALENMSLTVRPMDAAALARRERLGHIERAPLVVERYESDWDSSVAMTGWDGVRRTLELPHRIDNADLGSVILGDLSATSLSREQLDVVAGKRF